MNSFYTACPVVDRTNETFFQRVVVGGQPQNLPFTRKILWLQRSEAQIRLVHGGHVVRECGVYCDSRYLTSLESLDPQAQADYYGVTAQSSLEVAVFVSILQQPVLEPCDDALVQAYAGKTMKRYDNVPSDWHQLAQRDGQTVYPRLAEKNLGEEIIWSSKNTPEENEALKRAFIEKWSVGVSA